MGRSTRAPSSSRFARPSMRGSSNGLRQRTPFHRTGLERATSLSSKPRNVYRGGSPYSQRSQATGVAPGGSSGSAQSFARQARPYKPIGNRSGGSVRQLADGNGRASLHTTHAPISRMSAGQAAGVQRGKARVGGSNVALDHRATQGFRGSGGAFRAGGINSHLGSNGLHEFGGHHDGHHGLSHGGHHGFHPYQYAYGLSYGHYGHHSGYYRYPYYYGTHYGFHLGYTSYPYAAYPSYFDVDDYPYSSVTYSPYPVQHESYVTVYDLDPQVERSYDDAVNIYINGQTAAPNVGSAGGGRAFSGTVAPQAGAASVATNASVVKIPEATERGHVAFRTKDYQAARQHYMESVLDDEQDGFAKLFLGLSSFTLGDYHLASRAILRALETTPELVEFPIDLRQFYGEANAWEPQLAALDLYTNANPGNVDAQLLLAYLQFAMGEADHALETVGRVSDTSAEGDIATRLGDAIRQITQDASKPQPPQ